MAKNLWQRIQSAAIEGKLFSKGTQYLARRLDYSLGRLYRYFWTKHLKVNPKQIMFTTFQGDYTCNPKYIVEALRKRKHGYDIVFGASNESLYNQTFPEEIRLVEQYSMDYYKELAQSKLIISNSVEFQKLPSAKKTEQCWIETWHGSLGIKRFDASSNNGREWVSAARRVGRLSDYIISNSVFENLVYRESFWPHTEILEFGHPRNDILLNYNEGLRTEILQKILPSANKQDNIQEYRYALYAPTFRDNHSLAPYSIDFDRLCSALSTKFGSDWKVLIRLHPTVREKAKMLEKNDNIIDLTYYPDIQEIMLISDVAITDYSSWIYDYILTRRPGFIFATDIHSYDQERGFYYPLSATPFAIARNNDELEHIIQAYDDSIYQKKVEEFLKQKGCFEAGNASEKTVDLIEKIMEAEE